MDRDEFCMYLESTLIPDLIEMGMVRTADDFTTCLRFIRNRKAEVVEAGDNQSHVERDGFVSYLRKTLIPDLRKSHILTARDLLTASRFIAYPSLNFYGPAARAA